MSKTDTVAIIAAILAVTDDLMRQAAKVDPSSEPARFVDDAVEIYDASQKQVAGAESKRRYGVA